MTEKQIELMVAYFGLCADIREGRIDYETAEKRSKFFNELAEEDKFFVAFSDEMNEVITGYRKPELWD